MYEYILCISWILLSITAKNLFLNSYTFKYYVTLNYIYDNIFKRYLLKQKTGVVFTFGCYVYATAKLIENYQC